jgi:4-amino-4-deoxy-L-arabinose transferase-like glycosyltransferase
LRLFRRRGFALATGLAAALHPSFVLTATEVQSEPLFLVLLLASGFLLLAAADRPSSNLALAAGAALALAALTRSTALVLAPLLLAPLGDSRYPIRARWHLAGSALLGFGLALSPWTLRNALAFGELLPVNDAGGYSLYHGNSIWTRRYYEIRTRPEFDRWIRDFDADMQARIARVDRQGLFSPGQRSAFFAKMAIEEARADPAGELRLLLQKAWQWLRPYPTPYFWPMPVVVAIGALYAALDVVAALGLATAPRRGAVWFCLAVLGVTMLAHVVLLVLWRYRVPYWDPILLLFAALGAEALWRGRRVRSA